MNDRPARRPVPALLLALAFILGAGCATASRSFHPRALEMQARGAQRLADGELDGAAGLFALALEYEPRLALAENGLGLVARARGEHAQAEAHFRRALAIDEDFAEAHLNLGWSMLQGQQVELALKHLRSALAIDPGYGAARLALALARLQTGEPALALWDLRKLVEVEPEDPHGHAVLGLCLIRLGRVSAAGQAIDRALALAPGNVIANRAKGELLRTGGDLTGAEAAFRRALAAEPGSVEDRLGLLTALIAQGEERYEEAEQLLRGLLAAAPRRAEVAFADAFLGLRKGELGRARGAAERALSLRASYAEARLLLAESLALAGRTHDARAELETFVAEAPAALEVEKARARAFLQTD